MFYFDSYYLILVLPAIILAMWAQFSVQAAYKKYSQMENRRGITGEQLTRMILDRNGLQDVKIEHIDGNLSDHYDPRSNTVRLSDGVYSSTSVAALGIAAHECGHAVQHDAGYSPIKLRNAFVPVANIGSYAAIPVIILGFFLGLPILINIGIILFATVALFQLITLPVEFDASSRAIRTLDDYAILTEEEQRGARKVLNAAAMTYVAALAVTLMQLLRLVFLSGGGRRRD